MKQGLSGAGIKWIAIITMLIDHIGAIPFSDFLFEQGIDPFAGDFSNGYVIIYWVLRLIGRLSYPLFAFLLVEGFLHTRDYFKYFMNLLVFGIISEPVFDYAQTFKWFSIDQQSIFVTLMVGLMMLMVLELVGNDLYQWLIVLGFGLINEFIKADYGLYGILIIGGLYLLRKNIPMRNAFIFIIGIYQMIQGFSIFIINKYNGTRGKQNKYFFYLFYPIHLLVLSYL